MRILYLTESHPRWVSGSAILSRRVAAWMSRTHEVAYACPSAGDANVQVEGFQGKLILLPSLPNPWRQNHRLITPSPRRLSSVLDQIAPDVLHVYDPSPASIYVVLRAMQRRVKLVVTHVFYPHFGLAYLGLGANATLTNRSRHLAAGLLRVLATYYNRASAIIVPTRTLQEYLRPYVKAPLHIISAGVDCDAFAHACAADGLPILERLGIRCRPTVLYVGRMDKDKNLDVLLSAWRVVVEKGANDHLLMVGDGMERARLMRRAAELNIQDSISWTGMLPEQQLPAIYAISTLAGLLITCNVETQSIVVLQALAAGLPVVGADSGALPELVIDGRTGFLCSPNDPDSYARGVLKLTGNPGIRDSLRGSCQRLAAGHSFQTSIAAYESLYNALAGAA
jgi:glycosyltransferase involved in cell wall biosynthesis